MENSFHGRTLATLAATGQTKYRKGFEPDVDGFSHVPFGNLSALKDSVRDNTAAIMLEPIQGEGGVRVADGSYFQELRRFCDSTGCLLIFDEVQTGMGRTGKLFAYELFDIEPDIMTLAKGIAGGVPMGAVLAKDSVASAFVPGTHASTFGGNPLSSAAALYVMGQITSPEFLDNVKSKGAYLHNQLNQVRHDFSVVKDVRGFGLMQAIELSMPGAEIVSEMRNLGILVNCTSDTVLRFLPPLIVSEREIDTMIAALRSVLQGKGDPRQ
jgi:acetylornithine/succinyldiaminopimelate/putrescine aminotransferase